MTNSNYLLYTEDNQKYVLRLPNQINSLLINRKYEQCNAKLASDINININININVETIYFNKITGVKLTKYIDDGMTLSKDSFKDQVILSMVIRTIHNLHNSQIRFNNDFNVFSEFDYYLSLLKNKNYLLKYKTDIFKIIDFLFYIKEYYQFFSRKCVPCHNDLVPENFILRKNDLFIIDWEYSGMNNPTFDLSSLFTEGNFDIYQKEFCLEKYFGKKIFLENKEHIFLDIKVYSFLQDLLWFLWTVIKEENNEDFGDYAKDRLDRAVRTKSGLNI
ncbi:choline kinase family protein [Avibacterium paragallinarum]|uniref:LicA protein n=1 Tax=Avibacterium paragallinarum TaxID=728 RepID=A0A377I5G9_AVIPA|nr:choline kinase family protein [Avibacterium paragallinarum]POY45734.1 choline kinase [Avibacterium paragallinarum]CDF97983.1 Putative uncharacterized protein [Avibacterium paragallinarum JF4211]STO70575.1 LicA protein [Avibacterium paragallinarum]